MGEIVEFPSNGKMATGYLATPGSPGPGVIVVQEWWGLVDHIKDVAERYAREGFVALAPDLYHGKTTTEPDEATKMMMDLKIQEAGKDMSGAVDFLLAHETVEPKKVGSVGFCMGGALSLVLGALRPVDAVVSYYGIPAQSQPDYSKIRGAVLMHVAEHDDWVTQDAAGGLAQHLQELGKPVEMHVYPGTEHAFFNDTRTEVYNKEAAEESWRRTNEFFKQYLQ